MTAVIVIRGGGDLASGVALRLRRVGLNVVVIELPQPLAVRRAVSFAEAVYEGQITVEGVTARLTSADQYQVAMEAGEIPVVVDPDASILQNPLLISPRFTVVVDGRMLKRAPEPLPIKPLLHIGLGPGFIAGENCDAVIETQRGHTMGRVIWKGSTNADSSQPEGDPRRVLRAPCDGVLKSEAKIGGHFDSGQPIAAINDEVITAPFAGVLRGLLRPGLNVSKGLKIGDLDARDDPRLCELVSDKSLAVGGAVLEALFARPEVKEILWA
jgi:xanthine dehydrogenase accessory factor